MHSIIYRIHSRLNRYYSKYLVRNKSRVFQCGEVSLKYLYVPRRGSRTLITVFSGMNPTRASYSYINQLNDTSHNRLYILDDFGDEILGCFYLGTNEQFQVEHAVRCLLAELGAKHRYEKYIFCGSSKGGYAALNFGIEYPDTKPYETILAALTKSKEAMDQAAEADNHVSSQAIVRPWLQDFTASYLGEGKYIQYGYEQIQEQIRAVEDAGYDEWMLWSAANRYHLKPAEPAAESAPQP